MEPSSFNLASRLQTRRRIVNEPRWQPVGHVTSSTLAPGLRTWLTDDGSLTARLTNSGRGKFSVQRLYQGWEVPLPSERILLELPARQLALVREVALLLGHDTVVFARSVFPISSLTGSLAHLRRLQNKSLGAILFRHPGMRRHPFELALMAGDTDYLPANLKQAGPTWGRRSRFEIGGKKLMVSEVFLEAFTPWQESLHIHRMQRGKVSAAFRTSTQ
ncbi:Chorismate pyruvate-lyase [Halioglobus japonicus]|nr:Chorismate pyruvate-lyase [Halioglobus japonicus]